MQKGLGQELRMKVPCCSFCLLGLYWGYIGVILGLYWDNGTGNGNYYSILGLYWDNGKENGNYYSILGLYWGYVL